MSIIRYFLNIVFGTVLLLATVVLTLIILRDHIPGFSKMISEGRCWAGIPEEGSSCVNDEIAVLRAAQDETARINRELKQQISAQEKREAELERLSAEVENFTLFETESLDFGSVTTGVRFGTVLRPEEWDRAWCYVERSVKGLPRKVELAEQDVGQTIRWNRISDAQLHDADLTPAQLEQAKAACRFPDVS